ncbi:Segregation and condensation protein A [uncultured archaeon]|nr:Segregation and condensation protein A [uncultured archaeon]
MDFEEFLPEKSEEESQDELFEDKAEVEDKISPNQFYDVITSRKPDWQSIIYELIATNKLDPWDIDIVILTKRYFEKIIELEEAEFYVSSKVLLAAALLLRIKSEFLLNRHMKSIDDILFGKKDDKKYIAERIIIDESDLPVLIPKTPLPRLKRVTLDELMTALNHAIETESRRIRREVAIKRAKKLSEVDFPSFRRIDLKDRIKQFYAKILTSIKKGSTGKERDLNKIAYTHLAGEDREERLACFLPLLHLSNNKKLWLEQECHLEEIYIYLYEYFDKNRDKFLEELEEDIEDMKQELSEEIGENLDDESINQPIKDQVTLGIEEIENSFKNSETVPSQEVLEVEQKLKEELDHVSKEEEIDKVTGFSEEL